MGKRIASFSIFFLLFLIPTYLDYWEQLNDQLINRYNGYAIGYFEYFFIIFIVFFHSFIFGFIGVLSLHLFETFKNFQFNHVKKIFFYVVLIISIAFSSLTIWMALDLNPHKIYFTNPLYLWFIPLSWLIAGIIVSSGIYGFIWVIEKLTLQIKNKLRN